MLSLGSVRVVMVMAWLGGRWSVLVLLFRHGAGARLKPKFISCPQVYLAGSLQGHH